MALRFDNKGAFPCAYCNTACVCAQRKATAAMIILAFFGNLIGIVGQTLYMCEYDFRKLSSIGVALGAFCGYVPPHASTRACVYVYGVECVLAYHSSYRIPACEAVRGSA